ncbi:MULTISPECIES: DUF1654 domain-containing protein [unclassified Pseudomonas]|uniref:DUF1654 domain-containing protein n=1 Tax=unclassified Pseudomonas TaxID=196821 RepID=UPI0025E07BB7|nr:MULTISPECIES: DUF1654 domain-containing protein [unclassified Pseudomonas]
MALKQPKFPALPTSLETLSARLQKIINSPASQKAQSAFICKAPDERQEDWESIVEAIAETDGVHIVHHENSALRLSWEVPGQAKTK